MRRLGELTSFELEALRRDRTAVALLPVGSVEPHGPHLPLDTDTRISDGAIARAATQLEADGLLVLVCPAVPYGVTDFASGFAGAVSVAASALTPFLRAVVAGLLEGAADHVCVVNNHLEPEQDAAIRAAITQAWTDAGAASVACPLTRRWGRTLSDEYKRGNCHAGQYETSLVLAHSPDLVEPSHQRLPAIETSLSEGIRAGQTTFAAMGLSQAYTGAPAAASTEEGIDLFERLALMVATEVREALARRAVKS